MNVREVIYVETQSTLNWNGQGRQQKKKRKGTRLRYVIVVPPYPDVHREKDSSKK